MGTSKCCCYIVFGIILLWALSSWQQENNWGQPQEDEEWEWGSTPGLEDPWGQPEETEETVPMVTVTFASGTLKIGFADEGTPVSATYERIEAGTKFLKIDYSDAPSDEVQVQSGSIILIGFVIDAYDGMIEVVQFPTPATCPPNTVLQVQEVTAYYSYLVWRVIYWEGEVLKEVEV